MTGRPPHSAPDLAGHGDHVARALRGRAGPGEPLDDVVQQALLAAVTHGPPDDADGALRAAMDALPDPYRSVVLARFDDGLAPREIAAQQGLPVATVKTRLQRGLDRLRAELIGARAGAGAPRTPTGGIDVIAKQKQTTPGAAPRGWLLAGSDPGDYRAGVESPGGRRAGTIACTARRPRGFGTLMQTFRADAYRGQRLRLSAEVRTADVDWSGLWMRIDGAGEQGAVLGFDNMAERPIRGTTDWTRHDVVLEVPAAAVAIALGVLQSGKGQSWLTGLRVEVVGRDVPLTGHDLLEALPAAPENLAFDP